MSREDKSQELSKTTITLAADLGVEGVRIEFSERTGEEWVLRLAQTAAVQGESKLEITLLPELEAGLALEAGAKGLGGVEEFLEALAAVGEGPRVLGMDVSYAQGFALNFERAAGAGIKYCFIRAGSGMTERDPNFELNFMEAGRMGMLRGIYYYLYPEALATIGNPEDRSPEGQARRFAAMLKPGAELGAVLDVEANGLGPQEVQRFVDEFQKHDPYGRPIMIYTGGWYWNWQRGYVGPPVAWAAQHPLWVAQYTHDTQTILPTPAYQVAIPDPWNGFAFHQWTAVGGPLVQHASPGLDLNHFPGTLDDLLAWSGSDSALAPSPPLATKFVNVGGLNVRAEPRKQGAKLTTLPFGTEVSVYEEGQWDYIKVGDTVGYVFSQFLSP